MPEPPEGKLHVNHRPSWSSKECREVQPRAHLLISLFPEAFTKYLIHYKLNSTGQKSQNSHHVLEKTLESPLDCKEVQPVHSEGDQPWDFFGRNDAEAETPVLWPPHAKS